MRDIDTALAKTEVADIANLPPMQNRKIKAAMGILAIAIAPAYQVRMLLFQMFAIRQLQLTLQWGLTTQTPVACVLYGMMLAGSWLDVERGYQFGRLGVELLERPGMESVKSTTRHLFHNHLQNIKDPARLSLQPALEGGLVGIETGEYQYSGYCILVRFMTAYFAGVELDVLERDLGIYRELLEQTKQEITLEYYRILQQVVANLRSTNARIDLRGEFFNEEESVPAFYEKEDRSGIAYFLVHKLALCGLFEEVTRGIEVAGEGEKVVGNLAGMTSVPAFHFYNCLLRLKEAERQKAQSHEIAGESFQNSFEQLGKFAVSAPVNYEHKLQLVEAERYRLLGQKMEAIDLYDRAIAGAKENEYVQEEALANELAAKFYLDWGKEKIASVYMTDAYYGYARWGAKAKVEDLEIRYPQLLKPILEKTNTNTNSGMGLSDAQNQTSSISNISSLVDFSSLLKAGRSLSKEIDLQSAIAKFMEVIQENAGAQTVALMLFQEDTLMLQAHATGEKMSLLQIPVETSNNVPKTLVYRVKNTHEHLVLDNAKENNDYNRDDYINKYQPKSVLCMPLIDRGQLIGILYLENNQTSGAFTSDRIEILNLLCSQAAISLENAQLYNNLEIKVQERTAELSQALQNLKDTQKQLVESEKMASLGSLVAGVAHEINTPVGTCITVASTLNEETQAFAEAIANGQLKRSVLNNYIETCTECTQLIGSNLKRAGELIGSFKQVAVDRTHLEMRTFAIKPYLEEVLTSLMPNIRQQGHEVSVEGDENIQLKTYPGALAQIVTNLTNNSLVHAYPDGQSGQLNWRIELKEEEKLIIEYEDDGCGIAKAELEKIFEPFYTTARNQGRTGLGLHIVYNLVTQKLLGTIWVQSQVGQGVKYTLSIPK